MPVGVKMPTPEAPRSPERIVSPEAPKEGAAETRGEKRPVERAVPAEKEKAPAPMPIASTPAAPVAVQKSQMQQDIEDILAEDLKELYMTLSPQQKILFKREGEKTAARIEVLLKSVKVKISEILHLIRLWLAILPGVNKFFLEKEVKIKAEHILELKEQENEYK